MRFEIVASRVPEWTRTEAAAAVPGVCVAPGVGVPAAVGVGIAAAVEAGVGLPPPEGVDVWAGVALALEAAAGVPAGAPPPPLHAASPMVPMVAMLAINRSVTATP